jgi:hypothetical protein
MTRSEALGSAGKYHPQEIVYPTTLDKLLTVPFPLLAILRWQVTGFQPSEENVSCERGHGLQISARRRLARR